MGALHAGHAALIESARADFTTVIASIFVNPTQFNVLADLKAYPRTVDADIECLVTSGCDALYLPAMSDVYPADYVDPTVGLAFGQLVDVMEGAQRPGHFAGVAQVVHRLLDIVKPDTVFLGQKDYQQVAVVRSMINQQNLPYAIRVIPTVRETDGLALSSRNQRLNGAQRAAASTINLHLHAVAAGVRAGWPPRQLEITALRELNNHDLLQPEYVSVFDGDTLQPWQEGEAARELVVATAVHCGPVRLIDNLIISTTPTT